MKNISKVICLTLALIMVTVFTPDLVSAESDVDDYNVMYNLEQSGVKPELDLKSSAELKEEEQARSDLNEKLSDWNAEIDNIENESMKKTGNMKNSSSSHASKTASVDSDTDYTEIRTKEDLVAISNAPSGNYILVSDIDLSGVTWTPIKNFSGVLDGDGHTIKGLETYGDNDNSGLVCVNTGIIRNLVMKGGEISIGVTALTNNAGGIAGTNEGTIESCINYNKITPTGKYIEYVGGIAGYSSGTIINCKNYADIEAMNLYEKGFVQAGGLVGEARGVVSGLNYGEVLCIAMGLTYAGGIAGKAYSTCDTITNCYNKGMVTALSTGSSYPLSYAGGICGTSETDIKDSHNGGDVAAGGNFIVGGGGIVGSLGGGSVENCTNNKSVVVQCNEKGTLTYAGGIVGDAEDQNSFTIKNCHNSGIIVGGGKSNLLVGGIAGVCNQKISECYNTGDVAGKGKLDNYFTIATGGIVGRVTDSGSISNSYSTGGSYAFDDSANSNYGYNGGVCGMIAENATVSGCYSKGNLCSFEYSGGLVGSNAGTIRDCYFAGNFDCSEGVFGGLSAINETTGVIQNAYSVGTSDHGRTGASLVLDNQGSLKGTIVVCDLEYILAIYRGKTSESLYKEIFMKDMKKSSSFPKFSFNSVWKMGKGKYPLPILSKCPNPENQNNITIPLNKVYGEWIGGLYTYDKTEHRPLWVTNCCYYNSDFTLSGGKINAGKYVAKATGKYPFTGSVSRSFVINKAKNTMKVTGKKINIPENSIRKKNKSYKKKSVFTLKKAVGKVTFKKKSGNAKITISKNGKVTIKKGLKKGKYKINVVSAELI